MSTIVDGVKITTDMASTLKDWFGDLPDLTPLHDHIRYCDNIQNFICGVLVDPTNDLGYISTDIATKCLGHIMEIKTQLNLLFDGANKANG